MKSHGDPAVALIPAHFVERRAAKANFFLCVQI
jgi:hypothetical protein